MIPAINKTEDLINSGEILYLPCSKLKDHPLHFEFYTQSHLEGLVCSIREAGLLEPIVVCPLDDDNYRILSVEVRFEYFDKSKVYVWYDDRYYGEAYVYTEENDFIKRQEITQKIISALKIHRTSPGKCTGGYRPQWESILHGSERMH